jgi:hypothetical protein
MLGPPSRYERNSPPDWTIALDCSLRQVLNSWVIFVKSCQTP